MVPGCDKDHMWGTAQVLGILTVETSHLASQFLPERPSGSTSYYPLCGIWTPCSLKVSIKKFIYLFIFRGGGREKERETPVCSCLLCTPYWGPGPQPRHVPWLGIEPVTLWFTGWHSIHWATPIRAKTYILKHSSVSASWRLGWLKTRIQLLRRWY